MNELEKPATEIEKKRQAILVETGLSVKIGDTLAYLIHSEHRKGVRTMKYIYYVIYTLKQVAGALSLFCGGFCMLLNLQFVAGVEVDAVLLVGSALVGLFMFVNHEILRYISKHLRRKIEGGDR